MKGNAGNKYTNTPYENATIKLLKIISATSLELTPGADKEIAYFAGVDARNPSGTTDNINTIIYNLEGLTVLTQTLTYNMADNVIKIVNT